MIGILQETSFFGTKTNFRCNESSFVGQIKQTIPIRICLRKNKSKQSYVCIDSIFEAQNICFGSEIADLLDHSYHKCALTNSLNKLFTTLQPRSYTAFWGTLWTALMVNFGGKPAKPSNNWPERILLVTCMLVGTLVWIEFRANITSNLAVRIRKKPFDSLESFLKTDYE